MGYVKLAVDFEHASRVWWESGGQELWDGITEGFDGSSVMLDEHMAQSWLAEAKRLPGWEDGHEFAPHPIALQALDEDEELDL